MARWEKHMDAARRRRELGRKNRGQPPEEANRKNPMPVVPGQLPWAQLRVQWAVEIDKAHTQYGGYCISRYRARIWKTDRSLRKMVSAGYAKIHTIPTGPRSSNSVLRLTAAGCALLPVPMLPTLADPYAKRRQAIAEFKAANPG